MKTSVKSIGEPPLEVATVFSERRMPINWHSLRRTEGKTQVHPVNIAAASKWSWSTFALSCFAAVFYSLPACSFTPTFHMGTGVRSRSRSSTSPCLSGVVSEWNGYARIQPASPFVVQNLIGEVTKQDMRFPLGNPVFNLEWKLFFSWNLLCSQVSVATEKDQVP